LGCDVRNCGGEGSVEEALLAFGDAAEARAISRLSLSLSLSLSRLSPGYLPAISRLSLGYLSAVRCLSRLYLGYLPPGGGGVLRGV